MHSKYGVVMLHSESKNCFAICEIFFEEDDYLDWRFATETIKLPDFDVQAHLFNE